MHSQLLPPPPRPPPLPSVFVCSSKVYSYSLPTVLCNENLPWLSTSGTAENVLFFKAPRLRNRLFDVRSANPPPVCSLTSCQKTQTAESVVRRETLRQQGVMFSAPQTPNAGNGKDKRSSLIGLSSTLLCDSRPPPATSPIAGQVACVFVHSVHLQKSSKKK